MYTVKLHTFNLLILVYKLPHGKINLDACKFFTEAFGRRAPGQNFKLQMNFTCLIARKIFFRQRVINYWNDIPLECVNASSLSSFKQPYLSILCEKVIVNFCDSLLVTFIYQRFSYSFFLYYFAVFLFVQLNLVRFPSFWFGIRPFFLYTFVYVQWAFIFRSDTVYFFFLLLL